MTVRSAGILLYRRDPASALQVWIAHMGGPFWARKDAGAWSIPKGEINEGEGEDPLQAAIREAREELGVDIDGDFVALTPVRQAGGKLVHAWAVRADLDPAAVRSNTFELEWPPKSGRTQTFPEVDRAGWFRPDEARLTILKGQVPLIDELAALADRRPDLPRKS